MVKYLLLLLCLMSFNSFAQKQILYTDTSRIEIEIFRNGKSIYEFPFNRNVVYFNLFDTSGAALVIGLYDTLMLAKGLWYYYRPDGRLTKTVDFDFANWNVYDSSSFFLKEVLDSIKYRADAYILDLYGENFLKENVKWNIIGSAYYSSDGAGSSWTDEGNFDLPSEYLLSYDLLLDGQIYPQMIEIRIDRSGNQILPRLPSQRCRGFEKISMPNAFRINKSMALESIADCGLRKVLYDDSYSLLFWECDKKIVDNMFNGRYLYFLCHKTSEEFIDSIYVKLNFDVYVFNPWTGRYLEKRNVKVIKSKYDTKITPIFLSENLFK